MDLQHSYLGMKNHLKKVEEDMKEQSDVGTLIIQKATLEKTLQALTEEVEVLSRTNDQLLGDLNKRQYFNEYNESRQELAKMQEAHKALINTVQWRKEGNDYDFGTSRATSRQSLGYAPIIPQTKPSSSKMKFSPFCDNEEPSFQFQHAGHPKP